MIGLLRGANIGETVYRLFVAVAVAVIAGWLGFSLLAGRLHAWRADVWKDRAQVAAQAAQAAQANADSANAGAKNAAETRQEAAEAVAETKADTARAVQRIETYAHRPTPDLAVDPVDPDVLLELERAEDRARAAADRLQRTASR